MSPAKIEQHVKSASAGNPTRLSHRGWLELEREEGLRLQAYPDPASGGDPWTIGIGCTRWFDGRAVRPGDWLDSRAQAIELAELAVRPIEKKLGEWVKVPLRQAQFDALVLFAFNVGLDDDADDIAEGLGDSTLLKKLNAWDYEGAAAEFPKWNRAAGKVNRGLINRRARERAMFESRTEQEEIPPQTDILR